MHGRGLQALVLVPLVAVLTWLVVSSADGWADWVVFGAIIVTFLGFALAVAPNIYTRRHRTISREGGGTSRSSSPR